MIKNNYLEEIGMVPTAAKVPLPVALAILAVLAVAVGWFTVKEIRTYHPAADHVTMALRSATPGHALAAPPRAHPKPAAHRLA